MAQVAPRPSFAAALCVWRSHIFCHQRRTLSFLKPSTRSFQSIAPVLSNHTLSFPVAFSRRNLSFRAAAGPSDSGTVDSNLIHSMKNKIKEQLAAESVIVTDAYGDGRHVSINVVSTAFEGQSAVSRQRMVYKAIWEELQNTVHAVDQMTTKTPAEAAGS